MKTALPFDPARAELRKGVTLIEASAGTGKTYAIAGLILRFVLEEGISIGEILAVTYTVAATAELRERVRTRLRNALEDLRKKSGREETTIAFLKTAAPEQLAAALRNLDSAVQNFDEARIFTIHGFCQRVLGENAFESGALFDMEMLADAGPLLEEVARDFWRQRLFTAPPLIARLAVSLDKTPDYWMDLLEKTRNHPGIRVLPSPGELDTAALARLLEEKLAEIIAAWKQDRAEVTDILTTHKTLSRGEKTFRLDVVESMIQSLDTLAGNPDAASPGELDAIFSLTGVNDPEKLIGTKIPPSHRMFDLCMEFDALQEEYFNKLTHEFLAFAAGELPTRKEHQGVVTYDDLLVRVRTALQGPAGAAFAATTGGKYKVALIDEFQDTDPVQYDIFHGIFGGGAHHLYFIGDPKQAIYSFRGADVFTYRLAADAASREFTLGTNWRSEKRLLNAVNHLFESYPSLGAGIAYREVQPPEKPREGFAEMAGGAARLRFRWLQGGQGKEKFTATQAEPPVRAAVAADIARLKAAGVKLGGRDLRHGDMAVLVRSNKEASKLQELLRTRGIKSVLKTEKSVFHSREAKEMRLFLEGVLEPARGAALNAALTTLLVDPRPGDIGVLDGEDAVREARLEQFAAHHELWKKSGFMAMFRHLLVKQRVRERLVQLAGGERMLTNFMHLSELLHRAGAELRLTPHGLLGWLARQQQTPESGSTAEEHQLRLESDDDSVLIATIHKSKGLEYPVVFCPYLWKPGEGPKNSEIIFHDPEAGGQITFDLRDKRKAPEHGEASARERFEESLRILYVALTRAKNLCYVYAGDIKDFDVSPLGRIIGDPPTRGTLEKLVAGSDGTMDFEVIDPGADASKPAASPGVDDAVLRERNFHGSIPQTRMIASFSSLIAEAEEELAAVEIAEPEADNGAVFAAMSRFERSARAGLFWHDLLEHLDFQKDDTIDALVAEKLLSHGFENIPEALIAAHVRNLLAASLGEGVRLDGIALGDKRAEVEFSHPIAPITPRELQEVFARHGAQTDFSHELGRLDFRPAEGFMRGFIDLLFRADGRYYIADWKSNWLGANPGAYDPERLRDPMLRHFYFLQYHLYTVAADLFLSRVVPEYSYEKHFGGVFYIFLRGVDSAAPGRGVFFDRPAALLVKELRRTLTGGTP